MKAFFHFAGDSELGIAVRDSRYIFPAVEMLHLLGLALLLGSILLFNVRFFGWGMRRQTLPELASDFAPWTRLALILLLISGVPMFASKALDLWNEDFDTYMWKMGLIAAGTAFHYMVQVPLARRGNLSWGRPAAAISLFLWFSAAVAGLSLEFL